ncbi:MAG: serine protease [Reyranella sp.]|nr:serine protease [Reyranella sp.]
MSDFLKRLLGWIAIVAVLYAVNALFDLGDFQGPRRPLPPEAPAPAGPAALPPSGPTPSTPSIDLFVEESRGEGDSIGTAFLVAPRTWVTAAHVVQKCAVTYVRVQNRWERVEQKESHPTADVAILRTPVSAAPPRTVVTDRLPVLNQEGFHYGYPRGVPSSLYTRFVGRARIREGKPGTPIEQGWVWAEIERSPAGRGTLGGISGGPQLDRTGAVQGVTILESERLGRVTTAPIQRATQLLGASVPAVVAGGGRIDAADFARYGEQLRGSGTVALVFCSVSGRTRPRV